MKIGRETKDLDFLMTHIDARAEEIQKAITLIISDNSRDGFTFSYDKTELLIQSHMAYPGYRITLGIIFGQMKDKIKIDIGIGDAVTPKTHQLSLFQYKGKPLFEDVISLLVYPAESIFAEKLETIISKGAANSRMKDYHDLLLLTRDQKLIDLNILQNSLKETFQRRGTTLRHIFFDETELNSLQKLWTSHLKNLGNTALDLGFPQNISSAIEEINKYLLESVRE